MQGPQSQNSNTKNTHINELEITLEDKSNGVFKRLCEFNNDNQSTIDLNFLRQILALSNNKFNATVLRIITQYKLADAIKQGEFQSDSYYKKVLSNEEFSSFITGKDMKRLLFDNDNLADKRFSTEEYYKLFELLGGNEQGLSKADLKNGLTQAYQALSNPEKYLNSESQAVDNKLIDDEVNEIIEFLSEDNDQFLSIKDFINAMTSNTPFPKDSDDLLFKK